MCCPHPPGTVTFHPHQFIMSAHKNTLLIMVSPFASRPHRDLTTLRRRTRCDSSLGLLSVSNLRPSMSWPLTPTHHGPSIPLQGPQPELQDRRKWAKMIGADKTFCSNEHMLFLSTTLKIDIIWLQEKFQFSLQKNPFRGQICKWIISFSQRTVLLLILGLNVHHSHCASPWRKLCWANTKPSVITDGEIAPAARPNPFACLRDDIYYQHRVQPDRLHRSLLDCEQLCDNRRNSSSAESLLVFSWVSLQVLLCVGQNTVTNTVCHVHCRLKVVTFV